MRSGLLVAVCEEVSLRVNAQVIGLKDWLLMTYAFRRGKKAVHGVLM